MNPLATAALLALVPWALRRPRAADPGQGARPLGLARARGLVLRVAVVVAVVANWAYLIAAGR